MLSNFEPVEQIMKENINSFLFFIILLGEIKSVEIIFYRENILKLKLKGLSHFTKCPKNYFRCYTPL